MSSRSHRSEKVTVLEAERAAKPSGKADSQSLDGRTADTRDHPADRDHAGPNPTRPDQIAGTNSKHDDLAIIRTILKVLLPLAILFGGWSTYKYLKATAPEVKKKPKIERSFAVKVIKAVPGNQSPTLRLFGTTTAGRKVDIRALVAGQIIATGSGLREGGLVTKGDALLSIDPFDYSQTKIEAEAQLSSAHAKQREQQASLAADKTTLRFAREQLKLSKTDLQRAIPLARRGTVSKRTLDDRRNVAITREQTVEQLQNSIHVWEARIAQQKATIERMASAVNRAERKLKETRLIAPFDAYVTQVGAQVGRIVSANDKVATLIDRDWIEVRFTLTDTQFGRIMAADKTLTGRKISVSWNVGNKPLIYPAVIERVGAQIAADSGGVEIYARLANPLLPVELRPGAFVEILVPDTRYANVYRLPSTVLYNGNTVYAIKDGRLVARKVNQIGIAGNDLLLTGAIVPGEPVINTRLSTPGNGLKVTVHKSEKPGGE